MKPHQLKEELISGNPSPNEASGFNLFTEIRNNPIEGYTTRFLPAEVNELGTFELQLTFDPDQHLVLVTACHQNVFYESETPLDAERRAFHESIVVRDLSGQHEFGWGEVRHFFCEIKETDYLAIIFTPGTNVPQQDGPKPLRLAERQPEPKEDKDFIKNW